MVIKRSKVKRKPRVKDPKKLEEFVLEIEYTIYQYDGNGKTTIHSHCTRKINVFEILKTIDLDKLSFLLSRIASIPINYREIQGAQWFIITNWDEIQNQLTTSLKGAKKC